MQTDIVERKASESWYIISRKQDHKPPHCKWHYLLRYKDWVN